MFAVCIYPKCPRAGVFNNPGSCWEHCKEFEESNERLSCAEKRHRHTRNVLNKLERAIKDIDDIARDIRMLTGGPIEIIVDMVKEFPDELTTLMTRREQTAAGDLAMAKDQHAKTIDRLVELQDVAMVSTEKHVAKFVSGLTQHALYKPGGPMYKRSMSSFEKLSTDSR